MDNEQPDLLDHEPLPQATQRQLFPINLSVDSQDDLTMSFKDPEEPPRNLGVLKPEEEEEEPSSQKLIGESIDRVSLIQRTTPHLVFKNSTKTGFYPFGIPGRVANFFFLVLLGVYLYI